MCSYSISYKSSWHQSQCMLMVTCHLGFIRIEINLDEQLDRSQFWIARKGCPFWSSLKSEGKIKSSNFLFKLYVSFPISVQNHNLYFMEMEQAHILACRSSTFGCLQCSQWGVLLHQCNHNILYQPNYLWSDWQYVCYGKAARRSDLKNIYVKLQEGTQALHLISSSRNIQQNICVIFI